MTTETEVHHSCEACGKPIPDPEARAVIAKNGLALHDGCLDTRHTFHVVDFDGEGGPACLDSEDAEDFIKNEIEAHNDPEITRDLYTVKEVEMTWREYTDLGEFDGY